MTCTFRWHLSDKTALRGPRAVLSSTRVFFLPASGFQGHDQLLWERGQKWAYVLTFFFFFFLGEGGLSDFNPSTALDLEVLAQPDKTSLLLDNLPFPKDLDTRGRVVILGKKEDSFDFWTAHVSALKRASFSCVEFDTIFQLIYRALLNNYNNYKYLTCERNKGITEERRRVQFT